MLQGRVVALDKTPMKVEKITSNMKRWDLTCVECYVYDSTKAVDSSAGEYNTTYSVDPDEKPHSMGSDQGLHCLPLSSQLIDTSTV